MKFSNFSFSLLVAVCIATFGGSVAAETINGVTNTSNGVVTEVPATLVPEFSCPENTMDFSISIGVGGSSVHKKICVDPKDPTRAKKFLPFVDKIIKQQQLLLEMMAN